MPAQGFSSVLNAVIIRENGPVSKLGGSPRQARAQFHTRTGTPPSGGPSEPTAVLPRKRSVPDPPDPPDPQFAHPTVRVSNGARPARRRQSQPLSLRKSNVLNLISRNAKVIRTTKAEKGGVAGSAPPGTQVSTFGIASQPGPLSGPRSFTFPPCPCTPRLKLFWRARAGFVS